MIKDFISDVLLTIRKGIYFFYSNNESINGTYKSYQPVVIRGKGQITFGSDVSIGVINSPRLYNSYAYIEARSKNASIVFGNNIHINNAFSAISEKKITINADVLIGYNCQITDSNFHDLDIGIRNHTDPEPKEVIIESNVFIGNNVTILKGVIIGKNSVVATGSIVTKSVPENVVVGGCPATIIRSLV